ncbi:MAG: phosphoribosylamine--glycine ligase [Eubacteriales bacterium]|nr:phosphoribosylamine--glycine ligase [Eubacteriales bacterium]
MKIMVVGGGGREHAIIKKIKENPDVEKIYAVPGNGGMAQDAECVDIDAEDVPAVVGYAKELKPDYAVVAPDDPLVAGMVDELEKIGIPCFGPEAKAAIIEGSKAFSKDLMKKYGIPTAQYATFTEEEPALEYVSKCDIPVVVKASGLAKGKGVIICETREQAVDAVKSMMEEKKFGNSGMTVVIEEFLEGPEVSVLSFTDGETLIPMISSMDHKRAFDGDKGLNTGGMGTIAPNPYYTQEIADQCMKEIFLPTMAAMNAEGRTFKGCLYFGLMITKDGPKVIEYNCRFGDPEAQVVLPLLDSDLLSIMMHCTDGTLKDADVRFAHDEAACCVVMATKGYPESYGKGFPIDIPEDVRDHVYVAGADLGEGGQLLSHGGRVLGVTERGKTLKEAIDKAYASVEKISFPDGFYRHDIGARAMKALEK